MMDKHYVYKFSKGDEILYIGRTNNITRRFSSHSGTNFFNESDKFEFMEFDNSVDHIVAELYLINKHKPKYNIASNNDNTPTGIDIKLPPFKDAANIKVSNQPNDPLNITKKIAKAKKDLKRVEEEQEYLLSNGFKNPEVKRGHNIFCKGEIEICFINSKKARYQINVEADLDTENEFVFNYDAKSSKEAYETVINNIPEKYFEGDERLLQVEDGEKFISGRSNFKSFYYKGLPDKRVLSTKY